MRSVVGLLMLASLCLFPLHFAQNRPEFTRAFLLNSSERLRGSKPSLGLSAIFERKLDFLNLASKRFIEIGGVCQLSPSGGDASPFSLHNLSIALL